MLIDSERESCATFPFAYILLELSLCESFFAFPHSSSQSWIDEEGMHFVGKGSKPTIEEQERMTKEY